MISAFLASTAEAAAPRGGVVQDLQTQAAHFGIEPQYIAWQLGSFSLLALVLYFFGIKPILATMDERRVKIEEGLRFSEEIKSKLAAAEKGAETTLAKAAAEAAAIVKKAREDAESRIAASSQDAIAKANEIIAKGNEAVALERARMLSEVRSEVARLVVATSSRVLARELGPEEKSRYAETAAREMTGAAR